MDRAGIYEPLYRMDRARSFEEWLAAVKTRGFPCFNIGYADKDGNIYYLYNGSLPVRSENYDWSLYLPGNTSETLWTSYVPFEALPQGLNPASGFVQNCNSTPYRTTTGAGNPRPEDFSPTLGIQTNMTNRALRALELLGGDQSITPEEFYAYKYDMTYSTKSVMAGLVEMLAAASAAELSGAAAALPEHLAPFAGPADLEAATTLLGSWDLTADPDSRVAALAVLTVQPVARTEDVELPRLVESLAGAIRTLKEHCGRIDPPWGEVNRLRRGDVDLPLGGGPDCLRNIAGRLKEDGRLRAVQGDS